MNATQSPETLAYSRPQKITGTPGDTSSARRPPSPPLYRAGTGREPGGQTPTWLADKINTNRRAARPQPCPRCGTDTLVGPDHDTCAYTARVDLEPVDPITEVIGLLAGRHSYDMVGSCLAHREPEHHHSPRRTHPVHLTHVCGGTA